MANAVRLARCRSPRTDQQQTRSITLDPADGQRPDEHREAMHATIGEKDRFEQGWGASCCPCLSPSPVVRCARRHAVGAPLWCDAEAMHLLDERDVQECGLPLSTLGERWARMRTLEKPWVTPARTLVVGKKDERRHRTRPRRTSIVVALCTRRRKHMRQCSQSTHVCSN